MAYNPIISRRQQQRNSQPGLSSLSNNQPAKGTSIVMVGGDPNKTYTYVPQSDYQTISYSDTMKKKAEEYTQSKSTGERIAGTVYREVDKAATAYEEFISPVTKTFDISTPANTGRPVQDFLANAGRGFINAFVSAPADIARLTGASGLSLAMLGKADTAKKGAEIVASGVPNFAGAQVESFKANPGAFAGGVAAGVVGGKAVGKVASVGKKKTGKTATDSSQKTVSGKTTPYRYNGANTRIDSSASGRKLVNKKTGRPVQQGYKNNTNSATLEKFLRQRRARDIAGDIEIGRLDRQFSNQVRQTGKITTVSTVRNAGKGRTKVVDFTTPKQQTALVTAKDARTPRNNSSKERARVARIVEVQKKSGALFQDMKLRRDPIPQRISLEKGLITAADARKPRNKTESERRRVQRVRMEQQKSGAMKTSAATLLDLQRAGKRGRPSSASSSGKKTTKPVRRPRAYETKVTRIERIDGVPGVYTLREVPRYAAGAARPITITKSGSVKFSGDDVILDAGFKLYLEPVRQPRLSRMPKPDKKPTGKSKGAGPKEKAKAESPSKKPVKIEYEKVDTEQYVKSSSSPNKSNRSTTRKTSTHAQRKNSGPGTNKKPANTGRKTADGKTIFRDMDGAEFVEVDAGNGMVYKVRVNPQETAKRTAVKPTTQKKKTTPLQKKQTVRKPKSKTTATGQQKTFQKRQVVRVVSGGPVSASGGQQNVLVLDTGGIADMDIDDTLIDSSVIETDDTTVAQNSSTKPAVVTQTRVSSSVKSAQKEESRTTGTPRARGKPKPAPAVRPKKKPKPVKSIEEDKKKQRKKIKKMKEEAYRLETVNTFAWITDTKPAAKPRRIK